VSVHRTIYNGPARDLMFVCAGSLRLGDLVAEPAMYGVVVDLTTTVTARRRDGELRRVELVRFMLRDDIRGWAAGAFSRPVDDFIRIARLVAASEGLAVAA